jgi:hypothetical protein
VDVKGFSTTPQSHVHKNHKVPRQSSRILITATSKMSVTIPAKRNDPPQTVAVRRFELNSVSRWRYFLSGRGPGDSHAGSVAPAIKFLWRQNSIYHH